MADFYSDWLTQSADIEKTVNDGPRLARGKDLKWVKTKQDAKAALMIAPEVGFPTGGSILMKGEIPVGWHTGEHFHGEEALYIEEGQGFMVVDGERYDFGQGSVMHVPFRSTHQLFNTGSEPILYLSALAWHLEASINMGKMEQLQECGANEAAQLESFPMAASQNWPVDGRRIVMNKDQYAIRENPGHGANYSLGGSGREGSGMSANGFKMTAAGITSIFVENPHFKSHSHAHPEAYLYCLEGKGYSEIGGKYYEWEKGDAVHVPPGMMHHQHFNPSDGKTQELRFEFGIRYWMTDQWKGYTTVDDALAAGKLDEEETKSHQHEGHGHSH
jgi:mannose-6-phosphate isomerase-like protein (cupin superfamily)